MGVWNQSVFDPIFASVLLRTGWTVSNQERLYGIGTRFWRYLIVKCSVRCSAEVKSAVSGGCGKKCRAAAPGPLCKSGSKLHALHTLARNPGAPERREACGFPLCALTWRLQFELWNLRASGWSGNRATNCGPHPGPLPSDGRGSGRSGNRASSCGAGFPGSDRTAGWRPPAAARRGLR